MKKSALIFTLLAVVAMIAVAGCGEKKESAESASETAAHSTPAQAPVKAANPNMWEGTVLETMNSGGYTYVYMDIGSEKIWAAGPQAEVAVGQVIVTDKGMPMPDFHAKSLERTFDLIYFVSSIRNHDDSEHAHSGSGDAVSGATESASEHTVVEKAEVADVAKVADGYTVEEIFAQGPSLGGKTVKVRGQVVKFTANIMGTNWVHIQDGTGVGETADLTVTTSATVEPGDMVTVEGPLTVNKDFGAGYKYAAIIEGATITKE